MNKIGCRATFELLPKLYKIGFRVFQFRMDEYDEEALGRYVETSRQLPRDAIMVCHARNFTNLVAGGGKTLDTISYLKRIIEICQLSNIKYIVVHPGYRASEADVKKRAPIISEAFSRDIFLESIGTLLSKLKNANCIMCLENGPGSKTGLQMASIDLLLSIIKEFDSPNIGLCYDTQHAWANGEDTEMRNLAARVCDLMHLNGTPENAKFGKHFDRHGKTAIDDSVGLTSQMLQNEFNLIDEDVPIIIERKPEVKNLSVFKKDFSTINKWLNEKFR